jgi:crossover junction endonuclease MUS81
MQFIIDTRETKFIELLKQKNTPKVKYQFTTSNLDIGDFIIINKDYEIIIERKCISDLLASVKDGRYREQKVRLMAEQTRKSGKMRFSYLIEGEISGKISSSDKTIINGALVSSTFRDSIPILRTYSIEDSLDMILRIYDRFSKDINDFFPKLENHTPIGNSNIESNNTNNTINITNTIDTTNTTNNINDINDTQLHTETENSLLSGGINKLYLQNIKKSKKGNLTPETWFIMALMNIPGISNTIAERIVEVYPSITSLYKAYEEQDQTENKEKLLAEIILTQNDKTKRRIGEVISRRVFEYLMKSRNIEQQDDKTE